jgi:hypothetical protein
MAFLKAYGNCKRFFCSILGICGKDFQKALATVLKLHGSYRQISQSHLKSLHRFPGGFKKIFFCFLAVLEQLLHIGARGLRKICESLKVLCKR